MGGVSKEVPQIELCYDRTLNQTDRNCIIFKALESQYLHLREPTVLSLSLKASRNSSPQLIESNSSERQHGGYVQRHAYLN